MKKIGTFFIVVAIIIAVFLSGCNAQESESGEKITVSVSIAPLAECLKAVCGDLCEVNILVPQGFSPETYEPTPQDREKLEKSSVFFGIEMPAEMALGSGIVPYYSFVEICDAQYPDRFFGTERDPHIWLSPKRMMVMANAAAEKMGEIDSENKAKYRAGAENYIAKIEEAQKQAESIFAEKTSRDFIVFHPSLGYFADDFGLTMHALEEEGKEAGPQELIAMIDFAKSKGITTLFYQEEISASVCASFAAEIGGKAVKISPLAENYTENIVTMAKAVAEALK